MALSHRFLTCESCGNIFSVDSKTKVLPKVCPQCEKAKNVLNLKKK